EPADRLQFAPGELFRQQRQHTGMMAGLARTLEIGGLVQHDVDVLAVAPALVEDGELQAVGFERSLPVVDDLAAVLAVNRYFAIRDQRAAVFASTESLRLQDAVQCQFRHGRHSTRIYRMARLR